MRDAWLEDRIAMTKKYGLTAIAGLAFMAFGFTFRQNFIMLPLIFIGILMLLPFFIHETVFTVWHWKRRHRGEHSDLWGTILVIETSGWFKIVYWFRHILPDWHGTGRYSD
jgi:hypothetical protein